MMRVKQLELVMPDQANKYGVPAEAPFLVSPFVTEQTFCSACEHFFSPLVYQVGYRTVSQHSRECQHAGIYVYNPGDIYVRPHFLASVEADGQIAADRFYAVQVSRITAFCSGCREPVDAGHVHHRRHRDVQQNV